MREVPWNIARGFLMGAADIVPGVSGGTVALVVGIYTRFIASLRSGSAALFALARLRRHDAMHHLRQVEWALLLPLAVGILLAIVTLAQLIENRLHETPIQMSAAFAGLVAGSTVVAWRTLRRRDGLRIAIILAAGIAVFVLLGLREGTSEADVGQISAPATWAYFASGAVAIWAMVLPGVSGSFILVTLGMYGPVLSAVNDRDLGAVAVFGLGAVIGLAAFSPVLHRALTHHYDTVMAALIGLMAGSIRVLWPWPDGVDSTAIHSPDEAVLPAIALAIVGLVVVLAINAVAERIEAPSTEAAAIDG
jgi:putative membrane protein